jgi:Spy/CpxP family protein refolding chaperone
MKNLFRAAATMAFAFVIASSPVHAFKGPGGGLYEEEADTGRTAVSDAKREEVRKKIEAIRMWRLTEALKLDEKTSTKLASLLSSIEEQRRAAIRKQTADVRALSALLQKDNPGQGDLKALLEKIEKNQADIRSLRERELKGIKELLTVEQQARYVVFQQEFRREMRKMIAGARGGAAPGPGMGGGPGRGPKEEEPAAKRP